MKTRKKLKLAELKVRSFVTLDNAFLTETIKGGKVHMVDTLPSEGPPSTESTHFTAPVVCDKIYL
jgi:hypothetical protein